MIHVRPMRRGLTGYVTPRWYNAAGTRVIAVHSTRAHRNRASGDIDANARCTASPRSQTTKAIITTTTARFAGPRGFNPKTYAPRNPLTARAANERSARPVSVKTSVVAAVIPTRSRGSHARRG